ncbi:MAG: ribosome silencing factor [Chloroflexi bacterium]|nr:ribosome silencing factor [Chloroflexota bacterium]
MEPIEYARKIVDVAADKQATDILLLDIRNVGTFTDYFVIMTADNRRLMRALQEDVVEAVEKAGAALHHVEGTPDAGWLLLDFGDVIVHLFAPEERAYYALEELWAKGQQVVRIQ